MNIFNFFKKKQPVVGEEWALKDDGPWPSKNGTVLIIGVKDGWVRFAYSIILGSNNSWEVSRFLKIYRFYPLMERFKCD